MDLPRTRKEALTLGLPFYFTGKPCHRGHIVNRHAAGGCADCRKIDGKIAPKSPLSPAQCKARAKRSRAWRAANPERVKELNRIHYLADIKGRIAYAQEWAARNPERFKESKRRCDRKRKQKKLAETRNRRARKKAASGVHTAADIEAIRVAQRNKCAYCREPLPKRGWHVDHVIAIIRGGSNDRRNLQITCDFCNESKGARDPIDHAQKIGLLI